MEGKEGRKEVKPIGVHHEQQISTGRVLDRWLTVFTPLPVAP